MTAALELVQSAQPTWTRSALHRALGELLPAYAAPMDDDEAGGLLPALTDRAQRALTTLADEGLIVAVRGKGFYIKRNQT